MLLHTGRAFQNTDVTKQTNCVSPAAFTGDKRSSGAGAIVVEEETGVEKATGPTAVCCSCC
uniref:Uncharacterized protein n=1 Tax=Romanomermis culicivorax TaxID=13658 RepID=A0A915KQQ4_ROMCU